jgi:hypothetical protein
VNNDYWDYTTIGGQSNRKSTPKMSADSSPPEQMLKSIRSVGERETDPDLAPPLGVGFRNLPIDPVD